ncbi:MAG: extracellular solute-binding protein [Chloroflexi bacterium]|nr:extracellular solute-binding protein [Chloroflexota bacterium]
MRRLLLATIAAMMLAATLATACAPQAPPVAPAPPPAAGAAPAGTAREAWQTQWENLKAGARKEGVIVVVSGAAAAMRSVGMDKHLSDQFGVTLEFTAGLPSEVIPKILAERRAGLYLEDIVLTGGANAIGHLKPAGVLENLDQILFLPEAIDPKAWYIGEIPFVDKEHTSVATLAIAKANITINTSMVNRDEIKSYNDLLNPKWKGKIVLTDPTKAGGGNAFFASMAGGLMDLNFMRELGKQQPVIGRNDRLNAEVVAKGKYPILLGGREEIAKEFVDAGAPLELIIPKEGTYTTASSSVVTMLKNAPHPNAARLIANWLLTTEGGIFLSKAYGGHSARVDVPTEWVLPSQVRQPGVKYLRTDSEEYAVKQNEYQKVAAEMYAELLK